MNNTRTIGKKWRRSVSLAELFPLLEHPPELGVKFSLFEITSPSSEPRRRASSSAEREAVAASTSFSFRAERASDRCTHLRGHPCATTTLSAFKLSGAFETERKRTAVFRPACRIPRVGRRRVSFLVHRSGKWPGWRPAFRNHIK